VRRLGRWWLARSRPTANGASAYSSAAADDAEFHTRVGALLEALALGLEHRPQRADRHPLGHTQCPRASQTRGRIGRTRADVILANGASAPEALLQQARSVPVVFAVMADPVGDRRQMFSPAAKSAR